MLCVVCHKGFTSVEAEFAVETSAGPVHATCFKGPVAPPADAAELIQEAEEEEARRDHNDIPLPPWDALIETDAGTTALDFKVGHLPDDNGVQLSRYELLTGIFPCTPFSVADPLSRPRPDCPECGAEPSINGGRGLLCRGRSMLP